MGWNSIYYTLFKKMIISVVVLGLESELRRSPKSEIDSKQRFYCKSQTRQKSFSRSFNPINRQKSRFINLARVKRLEILILPEFNFGCS